MGIYGNDLMEYMKDISLDNIIESFFTCIDEMTNNIFSDVVNEGTDEEKSSKIKAAIGKIKDFLAKIFNKIIEKIKEFISNIDTKIKSAILKPGNYAIAILKKEKLESDIRAIENCFQDTSNFHGEGFEKTKEFLSKVFLEIKEDKKENAEQMIDKYFDVEVLEVELKDNSFKKTEYINLLKKQKEKVLSILPRIKEIKNCFQKTIDDIQKEYLDDKEEDEFTEDWKNLTELYKISVNQFKWLISTLAFSLNLTKLKNIKNLNKVEDED